jgi:dipeptidyl aminopeptidase/acylaminoacyl peptidase
VIWRGGLAAIALAVASPAVAATDAPDGTLLSSEPCPPSPVRNYDSYIAWLSERLAEEETLARVEAIAFTAPSETALRAMVESPQAVAEHLAYEGFECRVISYASGGLVIGGLLWKPSDTAGKRLPLIVANRGGNSDFGPMSAWAYWGWHEALKAGYVVLASQYRGGPGSEGRDEFGGRDLDDVRALLPLARSLGYVDTDNVFLFGGSRGGMQSYMLARSGFPARAMAIRAGLADLFRGAADRPQLERDNWSVLMPDYAAGRDAAFERRSASRWAGEIAIPTILFHGSNDWRLDTQDSLDVAAGLKRAGTPYELHLYDSDTHGIDLNQADMLAHALAFFERYRRR